MSPRLNVDLSEAQKLEALPDDTYSCKILEISEPKHGDKATYVKVTYEVIEGEFTGRRIWDNVMISGKAGGQFAELYEKVTGEELTYGEAGIEVDTDDLIGQEIGVVTVQDEYPEGSGRFSHKVKKLVQMQA